MSTYLVGDTDPLVFYVSADLTGVTGPVSVMLRRRGSSGATITKTATVTATTATESEVTATRTASEIAAGEYDACVVVTFSPGVVRTYPNTGEWPRVTLRERLA